MNNLTFNANLNLKSVPAILTVHGSIMTYRSDDQIEIDKAIPQGINPAILLLELKVVNGNGPMKGTAKPFNYEQDDADAKTYSQVTITYGNGESETEYVKIFG